MPIVLTIDDAMHTISALFHLVFVFSVSTHQTDTVFSWMFTQLISIHLQQYIKKRGNARISNIEGRSCYSCYSGKRVRITYSEWVFVALGIKHAKGMRHIAIWGLPGSTLSNKRHGFRKKRSLNIISLFLYKFTCNISDFKETRARYDQNHRLVFM
jgi:hypothetical protein